MTFVTYNYYVFLLIILALYYLIPHRFCGEQGRNILLLIASIYFSYTLGIKTALWLIVAIVVTYTFAIIIQYFNQRGKRRKAKIVTVMAIICCLLLLYAMKYIAYSMTLVEKIVAVCGAEAAMPEFSVIAPIGISFYLFQMLGYIIDIYKEKFSAEKNFINYALSISFFAKLIEGPIEPVDHFVEQIKKNRDFDWVKIRRGGGIDLIWSVPQTCDRRQIGIYCRLCICQYRHI